MISVGLLGFGLSGSVFHTPLITHNGEFQITGIVTSKNELAKKHCPEAVVVSSLEELLKLPGLDVVVVATPNYRHFEDAKAALEAGTHVVIEKPFTPTVAEGKRLIELAKEKKKILTVFHNRRWDGDFLTVKNLIQSGELGEIVHFESHFDRYRPEVGDRWKEKNDPGTGNFYDLGSHLIDQALQLFGEPDDVTADLETQRAGATATDYFHVVMKYGRKRVILHGGSLVTSPTPRFQIFGTLGSFVKFGFDPQEKLLQSGIAPKVYDGTLMRASGKTELIPTLPGSYETFYELLADAITDGEKPPVTPESALDVVRLIAQCIKPRLH